MKVLIIGAGVGGLASAITLARAGHEVEVYERADAPRLSGNGVLLFPNGTALLRELGVDLDGLGARMDAINGLAHDGRPAMTVRLAEIAAVHGSPILVSTRGRVLARLAALVPEGTVRYGRRCVAVTERAGPCEPVTVTFADGGQARGDAVIGADGHRSAVRAHLFGPDPAAPTGDATWHGITPVPGEFANGHRVFSVFGTEGICVMHPVGDGLVYWAFEVPWTDGQAAPPPAGGGTAGPGAPASPVAALRARFGHWTAPVLPQLLESITDADVGVFPHILHRIPRTWGTGPVTLAGDAAHAVPPRLGMGLNQALEDAWVLGHALTGTGTPAERLRRYEQARLPRIRRMRRLARMMGRRTVPAPPWLLRLLGDRLPATRLNLAQVGSLSNYLNRDLPAPPRPGGVPA
ncbi:FAD-dependent oxidoreductase [Marinactinospora rubrisoli]|uniref:FAD-dependent oxidoreductase n=1 Tax=Marinactinospora rubrisoli TaxID=2715399 RepID=A0ABW2KPK4_9ACTN